MAWATTGINIKGPQGDPGIQGPAGADGKSVSITGTVANAAALPTGLGTADAGKGWITADDGHLHVWSGTAFTDVGQVKGDKGDTGATGATGTAGATGAKGDTGNAATVGVTTPISGNAGSQPAVSNVGTTSAAVLQFTIPRGDTGATGVKGDTGTSGAQGPAGTRGSLWFSGNGTPTATGVTGMLAGDMYLDTSNGDVWAY